MRPNPHIEQFPNSTSNGKGYLKWYWPIPLLWLGLFSPQLLFGQCFFWYDHLMTNYPFKMFFARSWKDGCFPFWSHEYLCGYPIFASNEAAAAYPFSFLTALLPEPFGYSWFVSLHLLGAATGCFMLIRHLNLAPPSALLGSLVYGFSGCIWSRMHQITVLTGYCWLPIVVLAALLLAERLCCRRVVWLSLSSALLILGSHPQITLYALILAGGMGLSWPWVTGSKQRWYRSAICFSFSIVLAIGISAIQLVPFAELLQHTERGEALQEDYFLFGSLPPSQLVTLIMPDYFGTPANDSFWGSVEPGMFGEFCGYTGILPLLLALLAVICSRRKESRLFLAVLVIALLFSLGEFFPFYSYLRLVPVFGSTRIPARFLIITAFAISLLAAEGLQVIYDRFRSSSHNKPGVVLIFAACFLVGLGLTILLLRSELVALGQHEKYLASLPLETSSYSLIKSAMSPLLGSGLIHFFLATGACLGFGIALRSRLAKPEIACALAVVITAIDLAAFDWPMNPHAPKEVLQNEPRVASIMKDQDPPGRLHVVSELKMISGKRRRPVSAGWFGKGAEYIGCTENLDGNLPLLYRLNSIDGMTTLMLADYKNLLNASGVHGARIRFPVAPESPLLDVFGVSEILTPHPLNREGLQLQASIGDAFLYRNPWAHPRAFLTDKWETYDQPQSFMEELKQVSYRSIPEVHLLGNPDPITEGPHEREFRPLSGVAYSNNRVEIHWADGFDGLLVMLDTYYPGWKAHVNGREEKIWKVNGLFRAVRVRPSDNELILTYEPLSIKIGICITMISILLSALLWILGGRISDISSAQFGYEAEPVLPRWTIPVLSAGAIILCFLSSPRAWLDDLKEMSFGRYVAQCYSDLGVDYAEDGRVSDAKRLWSDALSIDPDCESALKNLEFLAEKSDTNPGGRTSPRSERRLP